MSKKKGLNSPCVCLFFWNYLLLVLTDFRHKMATATTANIASVIFTACTILCDNSFIITFQFYHALIEEAAATVVVITGLIPPSKNPLAYPLASATANLRSFPGEGKSLQDKASL